MPNIEQMTHVANSCKGYDSVGTGFQSSIGTSFSKSCDNCQHLKDNKCEVNLYDKVLAGLDQG
ncbi:hypothetical protein KPL35_17290 [Clostridium sp. CF011]|uniref:hypothetical protein n=1 Tax=unclassified Clostridium TaxID=2614128 RepID=UPI001C0C2E85|nr:MULTISPECIES: hypothetical protein [unclassified Clostridium]MBU3093791.1 hypothetical protein [Clostridium sp. CF011]MBW9147255.1 hypothetical protein [Clostridium sp. CM027]UVE39964.1 hypothetical protein KTC92_12285 [Clostridium sp. CM027]WAG68883.1 hypothetical protein LL036_12540 [Clostridium sp. CF011]